MGMQLRDYYQLGKAGSSAGAGRVLRSRCAELPLLLIGMRSSDSQAKDSQQEGPLGRGMRTPST